MQIEGAEAHAAQRSDQVQLTVQVFAVASCLTTSFASQLELQLVVIDGAGLELCFAGIPMDQILILACPMRPQAAEQFDRLQQIGFPHTIATNHQEARCLNLQLQIAVVAKPLQFQLEKPNGSGCGVSLRYLHRSGLRADFTQRHQPMWACSSVG